MTNLGGHDIETLIETFRAADAAGDQPTCFIAYTIKGMGLPFAGHKDNHAGLMTKEQMELFRSGMGIRPGHEWDLFEGLDVRADELQAFLDGVPVRHASDAKGRSADRADGRRSGGAAGAENSGPRVPPKAASATCWRRSAVARAN